MANLTLRGTSLPLDQRETIESTPTNGYVVQKEFAGTDATEMAALMYSFIRAGVSARLTTERGISRLETIDATQSFAIDVWQIVGNEESRDIWEHPSVSFISQNLLGLIRAYLEQLTEEARQAVDDSDDYQGLSEEDGATIERFVSLYLRGTTNYRRQQYVLRHTTNAPAGWASNIADVGVDAIYTTAQLLAEIENGDLWINPAPNRIVGKINAIPVPTVRDGYLWGWLKGSSTETTAANCRIEIQQEYVLEQWSTDLYATL